MHATISRKKNLCIYLIHKSKQTKLTLLNNNNKKEVANPVFPAFLLLQNVSAGWCPKEMTAKKSKQSF